MPPHDTIRRRGQSDVGQVQTNGPAASIEGQHGSCEGSGRPLESRFCRRLGGRG